MQGDEAPTREGRSITRMHAALEATHTLPATSQRINARVPILTGKLITGLKVCTAIASQPLLRAVLIVRPRACACAHDVFWMRHLRVRNAIELNIAVPPVHGAGTSLHIRVCIVS